MTFYARYTVIQTILLAGIYAAYLMGVAKLPFQGNNAILCFAMVGMGVLGLAAVLWQRWSDVKWLAIHVVRVGLLGTVIGLIIAFSAAKGGNVSDPDAVRGLISSVVDGMYVSLYATLLGISVNLWLKINMRLLGGFDE